MRETLVAAAFALTASLAGAADITSLTTRAAAAAKSGDNTGSIAALEQALEQVRTEAPLALKPFVVVKQPAKFYGDYEARVGTAFGKGEKMYFYLEPKNLIYPKSSAGLYEPAFEVDVEIAGPGGQSMKQPKFGSFRLPTRSRVQDVYLNLTLSLTSAPAGNYDVSFVVRDLNSKKTATVKQAVSVK